MAQPSEAHSLSRGDVLAASERIRGFARRTPMLAPPTDEPGPLLKCEFLQLTGSFKVRGAFNRVLAARERGELDPSVGIVAASGGNAGLANAYAARSIGATANVFVPETAPEVKLRRLEHYGATVHQVGSEYAEAYEAAIQFSQERGAIFCHAYDQIEIAAGAGTIAEEILAEYPEIDTIAVSVGGGGLFAGIAAAAEGRARIVAVEPRNIPTLYSAIEAGSAIDVEVAGVAADSLGARRIGEIAFDVASRTNPTSVLVEDSAILAARSLLWEEYRIAAEHGAAAALAALISGAYTPAADERVAVIVCGANTDPSSLS